MAWDKNSGALAHAGPIISYSRPLDRMMVDNSVPYFSGQNGALAQHTARPMDTPAWG